MLPKLSSYRAINIMMATPRHMPDACTMISSTFWREDGNSSLHGQGGKVENYRVQHQVSSKVLFLVFVAVLPASGPICLTAAVQ